MGFEPIDNDVPTLQEKLNKVGYLNGVIGKEEHMKPMDKFCWDFCIREVLFPLLMFPAAQNHFVILVAAMLAFVITTMGTMSLLVALGLKGTRLIHFESFERYSQALAGATILMCGIAIRFPGL